MMTTETMTAAEVFKRAEDTCWRNNCPNLALEVKRVGNAHAALVEACRAALAEWDDADDNKVTRKLSGEWVDAARAALELGEGK